MAKKKRVSTFTKAMLIYVLVFAAVAAGALYFLYNYMAAYEVSGSKPCIKEYMASLEQGVVPAALEAELDKLDESIQSREESKAWLAELVSEASCAKDSKESGQDYITYKLISRGRQIGSVRVENTGEEVYGLEMWAVAGDSFNIDGFIKNVSYYLPEDYSLIVGDAVIGASEECKEYKALNYVYDRFSGIPQMHKFQSGNFLENVSVSIKDFRGNEIGEEQLTEQYFLNNCDEELQARLSAFGEDFINRYVDFLAINGGNFYKNFISLDNIMLYDSELYNRIHSSWGGIFYTNTVYCKIHSLDVNFCAQLAENLYLVDVKYHTETKGLADPVWEDNFARVVAVEDENGQLVATQMYNY